MCELSLLLLRLLRLLRLLLLLLLLLLLRLLRLLLRPCVEELVCENINVQHLFYQYLAPLHDLVHVRHVGVELPCVRSHL